MLPPIYAVYCEELPERKAALKEHFASRGLPLNLWRSVHGSSFGIVSDAKNGPSTGEIGLLLGHLTLWQHLLLTGHSHAIVVEDDVWLPQDFEQRCEIVQTMLPESWDFCFLGHLENAAKINLVVAESKNLKLAKMNDPFGTHCYLLRRRAIPTLLQTISKARTAVDIMLIEDALPHLNWYAVLPPIARQRSAASETEKGEWPSTIR